MVQGGKLGGGERDAQLIDEYMVARGAPSRRPPTTSRSVTSIARSRCRARRRSGTRARRSRSTSARRDDRKQVLVVDTPPTGRGAGHARSSSRAGGSCARSRGTLDELAALVRHAATRSCGSSCANSPGPASPTRCARCCPQAVDVRDRARARPRSAGADRHRSAPDSGLAARPVRGSISTSPDRRDEPRVVALFDELLDADTDSRGAVVSASRG